MGDSLESSRSSFLLRDKDRVPTVSFALDQRSAQQQHRKSLPPTFTTNAGVLPLGPPLPPHHQHQQQQRGILRRPPTCSPTHTNHSGNMNNHNSNSNVRAPSSASTESTTLTQSSHEVLCSCVWEPNSATPTSGTPTTVPNLADRRRLSTIATVNRNSVLISPTGQHRPAAAAGNPLMTSSVHSALNRDPSSAYGKLRGDSVPTREPSHAEEGKRRAGEGSGMVQVPSDLCNTFCVRLVESTSGLSCSRVEFQQSSTLKMPQTRPYSLSVPPKR